ncbi:MAG: aminopeptidase P family N-terminal domain-containing protein, partial [Actinomycetota bacterium]|nr:aminopeptidase P family N-terminal domain-containing protein [Actinomycetota bacterium]
MERLARVRQRMDQLGIDVLLLSVGADLPWLTGYRAMPLERLTMLVVPSTGEATLVVPRLEAARVVEHPEVFRIRPWDEADDPVALVARLAGAPGAVAVGDRTWARFVVELQDRLGGTRWLAASTVTAALRATKD